MILWRLLLPTNLKVLEKFIWDKDNFNKMQLIANVYKRQFTKCSLLYYVCIFGISNFEYDTHNYRYRTLDTY